MLRQREPRLEFPSVLRAARGEQCTIRQPGWCNGNPETTIAAHSNWGKGIRQKADDLMIAFACSDCHRWLDISRDPDRPRIFLIAHARTLRRLLETGVLQVK